MNRTDKHTEDLFNAIFNNRSPFFQWDIKDDYYHVITNNDNACNIQIALPGFTKEEISLSVEDNKLNVSYKSPDEDTFKRPFAKTFNLIDSTDVSNITATMKNGILEIILPNKIIEKKSKTITIN